MKQRWKRWLGGVLGSALLLGCLPVSMQAGAAEEETTAVAESAAESEAKEDDSSTGRTVGIIGIFTVTCAVTAYFVMRPSLKKLKAAKAQQKSDSEK